MEAIKSPSTKTNSGPRGWVIILGLGLTAALATINWLQLASLERALDGVPIPDKQLLGYGVEDVEAVRTAITDELLERYGASHYLWDPLFALAFAATIILLVLRIAKGRKIRWAYVAVPVVYAVVDIAENLALEALLSAETVSLQAVSLASTLTTLKAVLFILCIVTALVTLGTRPRQQTVE